MNSSYILANDVLKLSPIIKKEQLCKLVLNELEESAVRL